jgi:hypothetical protein
MASLLQPPFTVAGHVVSDLRDVLETLTGKQVDRRSDWASIRMTKATHGIQEAARAEQIAAILGWPVADVEAASRAHLEAPLVNVVSKRHHEAMAARDGGAPQVGSTEP